MTGRGNLAGQNLNGCRKFIEKEFYLLGVIKLRFDGLFISKRACVYICFIKRL